MARAGVGGGLYDAVPAEDVTQYDGGKLAYNTGAELDPLYDEATNDTGYLGVEPAVNPACPGVYHDNQGN
jgi:hypothetical protein